MDPDEAARPRRRVPGAAGGAARLPVLLAAACRPAVLGSAAARALAALAVEHRAAAGSAVLRRSHAAAALWFVQQGTVALGQHTQAGMMQHRSVEGGHWLDVASGMLGGYYIEDAEAQTEAVVCELPVAAVQRCAQAHPGVTQALATVLAAEVATLVEDTRALATKDVLARCATWLLGHAQIEHDHDGRRVGGLRLAQRKRTIAQQLGTTAETFSRSLRQLSRLGLIDVQGYSILLRDADGLQRLADPPPARAGAGARSQRRAAAEVTQPTRGADEASVGLGALSQA
jgi:CRP-like cAMP-binding protein